jgi:hypothetical protein
MVELARPHRAFESVGFKFKSRSFLTRAKARRCRQSPDKHAAESARRVPPRQQVGAISTARGLAAAKLNQRRVCTGASSGETKAISGASSSGALRAVAGCSASPRSSSPNVEQAMIKPPVKNTSPSVAVRARNAAPAIRSAAPTGSA